MKVENTTALVTGANRGIGKALVEALIQAGAKKIYACARDIETLNVKQSTTEIIPLQLNVTDQQRVSEIAQEINDVTLLFNNAGVLDFGDILEIPIENIQRNFDTNFYGTLNMARALSPVIEANGGGAIVNTLTLLSLASMPQLAAYNASKAAAWSLTLSLRASLANRLVEVYGVFPGAVNTDMLDGVEMPKTSPTDVAQAIVRGIQEGEEDIFPDPMSIEVYGAWKNDHKAVEKQFAQM